MRQRPPHVEKAMINTAQFARVRRRVVGGCLSKLGYTASGKEYTANFGLHLRYVTFSTAFGKWFDVSIALHFEFLPPFKFAVWYGARIPSEMCGQLSSFQRLVRNDGKQYYDFPETETAAADLLQDVAIRAAKGLDEIAAICGDGQRLLELISPQVLAADLAVFRQLRQAPTMEEQHRLSSSMRIRQLFPEWHPHIVPTAILLGYLARHYGHRDLIPAYIAVAPTDLIEAREAPYLDDLQRSIN